MGPFSRRRRSPTSLPRLGTRLRSMPTRLLPSKRRNPKSKLFFPPKECLPPRDLLLHVLQLFLLAILPFTRLILKSKMFFNMYLQVSNLYSQICTYIFEASFLYLQMRKFALGSFSMILLMQA